MNMSRVPGEVLESSGMKLGPGLLTLSSGRMQHVREIEALKLVLQTEALLLWQPIWELTGIRPRLRDAKEIHFTESLLCVDC